ncbi:MAG TPA: tetratricopeptide repeat protein [Vicinamibacterales bacterium]|nr:tetratricopeptide repeat protein [Vicinamibacterales bacterium]
MITIQSGFWRGVLFRLLAAALAVGTVSDGRSSRVAYAQGATDPTVIKARAAINRGQYVDAEALLKPIAVRAPDGEAALELGLFYEMMGRRDESRPLLQRLSNIQAGPRTSASEYARLGRAARALGEFQLANDAYRIATEKAPDDPAVHTGWGELFLQVHNNSEAAKSFQDALRADDKWIPALLGMAQALLDVNPPGATKAVQQALALDPDVVAGYLLMAQIHLDKSDREAAKAAVATAKAINPVSLDALALNGAVAYIEDRQSDFQQETAAALKINPRFSDVYRVAGDLAAANYRFEEAVALSRKALALDANDARTLGALGVQLLRTGDEAEARTVLERAFARDKFNQTTFNLLTMLDSLEKFETITEGNIVVKMHSSEMPVMREYVLPLAQRALATFSEKYQFTPRGPILIEMFPKHDDFAVRTVGLPGMIGALGACFGRVVTLDSPKARPPGDFNWAPTLWHELAHVMTLQLSKQRVPRWLTEGISTYEEKLGSPAWGREGELTFVMAYGRREHMSVRELNAAFQDPEKISLAYYEASILTEHIVETYGIAALRKLLVTYGEGLEGEAALKAGLGVDIDKLQADFDKVLAGKYSAVVRALSPPKELEPGKGNPEAIAAAFPESFQAQVALGEFLWKAGRTDEAFKVLERAAQMVPMATGPKSPHSMMAQMALQRNDRARAIGELEKVLQQANTDLDSARLLAKHLQDTGAAPARLMTAYERIAQLDPFDAGNHSLLGRLKMQAGDARTAAREFRAAIASGSLDPASAHADLAESYLALGDKAQARRAILAAIEVAPGYPRAQDLLLKVVGQ